ncbi:MAG: hypothetical protein DLM67_23570 [Candidatus Nephthysia bennettiae]|nr:MAG: hypothetical protein DLM67_23570 [Candidatus Dormibacteraeota bacterium]
MPATGPGASMTPAAGDGEGISALRTVARVVAILELAAAEGSEGLTASEIASRLDIPASSAHSVVRRLNALGYLETAADGRHYRGGPNLVRLAVRLVGGLDAVALSRPVVSQLAAETGEDVYLALPYGNSISYADRAEGFHSLRLRIGLGEPRPLHATAAGKLYLAQLDDARLESVLRGATFAAYTPKTITDARRLRADLREIRARGFAKTLEEHLEGVIGIAAPVCNAHGDFSAAITMALPKARFERNQETLVARVLLAARTVSERLGWREGAAAAAARTTT